MIRFPVITLLLAAALAPGQTVLVRQDFDSDWSTINPPPGWTIFFDSDTSFNDWHRAPDTSGRNRWPDNPTPYALLDSAPHEEYGYDSLISPYFDCRGLNIVILRCSTFFQGSGVSFYTAQLRGAVDNGQFEHTVYDYYGRQVGPEVQEFPLTWAAGHDSCRLAWMFEGPTSAITGWALDNVHVTGLSSDIDVGVTEVLAPVGQVESAAVFQPVAIIANHGDPSASFPVYFNIGSAYRDSVLVESMPGHSVDTVEFAAWAARQRGDQRIVAHTLALGDIHPENDTVRDTVFVHVANVRPEIIYAPADTVDSNTVVQPRARVTNIGMDTADLYTYLYIGSDYVDSVLVDAFAPGDARDLNFGRNWTATTPGPQPVRCVTAWPPDNYRSDDTLAGSVFVRGAGFRDVAAVKVITPAGTVRESSFVFPRASVKNNGLQPVQLWASLRIALQETIQVYVDSVSLTLGPSQQDTVAFAGWTAWPPDTFRAVLRVNMPGDMDPSNDSARGAGRVLAAFHDVGVRRIVTPADTVIAGPVAPAAWAV
ncbi:hypothetical protein FJY71_04595, partial [candidate division WOR-3 bacterium]|nr:hypothetical protein [candidate division WOR-3 bacterium]